MSRYASLFEATDPVLTVTETDLEQADAYVDSVLRAKGIALTEVTLPHADLTALAVYYASHLNAVRESHDEGGVMRTKAEHYRRLYQDQAARISRASLGLDTSTTGSGYGSITLGRG